MKTLLKTLLIVSMLLGGLLGYVWWKYDTVVSLVLKPQTAAADNITDENFALMTPDGTHLAVGDIEGALARFPPQTDIAPRPLILFVHGFGPDPDGEFGLYTMDELAKGAEADVIMFKWPSWISVTEFPVLNAHAASVRLIGLLQKMAGLRHPGMILAGRPVMIVGHSMAGEVFRHIGQATGDLPAGLISRILFAVPETALPDHRLWMEKLGFADEIFVFVNADDPALQVTTTMYNTARLGRTLTNLDGSPEPLAKNANYILLDPESWRHYFFVSGQRSEAIDQIFADILKNGAAGLQNIYLRRQPVDNVYTVVGPGAESGEGR